MLSFRRGVRVLLVAVTATAAPAAAVAYPMLTSGSSTGAGAAQVRTVGSTAVAGATEGPLPADDFSMAVPDVPQVPTDAVAVAPVTVHPIATAPRHAAAPRAGRAARPATTAVAAVAPNTPLVGKANGPDIEGYARYEGQSTCDPTPKPGTLALRALLLSHYRNTRDFGISRACDIGGISEHKEGRAFDWGASVTNPAQRASVDNMMSQLLATDSYGHKNALARRMGVMYMIWNSQIWSAYNADAGWQPYTGSVPHTDHVHISLSWAGALGQTSFWSGTVVPGLPGDATPSDHGGGADHHPPSDYPPSDTPPTGTPPDGDHHSWPGGPGPTTTTTVGPTPTSTTSPPPTVAGGG